MVFWFKTALGAGTGMLVAQANPLVTPYAEYGLAGAIIVVVWLFLKDRLNSNKVRDAQLDTLKMLADNCHQAHQNDLKLVKEITSNVNVTMDKVLKAIGENSSGTS